MTNLCIEELVRIVGGQLRLGSLPPMGGTLEPIRRIVVDSRQVQPNDVFWGLPGRTHDGSRFAEEAYQRGALGAVVCGRHLEPWAGKFSIEVPDTWQALWKLARWFRDQFAGRMIAVAGVKGKSTTGQMLQAALSQHLEGQLLLGQSSQRRILPLEMLQLDATADYAVVELTGHAGELFQRQAACCCPDVSVVTAAERHGWPAAGDDSRWLASRLLARMACNGWAVLDGDDPQLRRAAERRDAKIIWVGRGSRCDITARQIQSDDQQLVFWIDRTRFVVPVPGRHYLKPALAAYAVGRILGLSPEQIAEGLLGFRALPGRCHVQRHQQITLIDDTFDASGDSLAVALDLLREQAQAGRQILVCGGLAGDSAGGGLDQLHEGLGRRIVTHWGIELLLACGPYAQTMAAAAHRAGMPRANAVVCSGPEQAVRSLCSVVRPGDAVLMKGIDPSHVAAFSRWLQHARSVAERGKANTGVPEAPTNITEALPYASIVREVDATLPPG